MTRKRLSLSLRAWVIATVLVISSLLGLAQYFLNFSYTKEVQEKFVKKTVELITNNMKTVMQFPLATGDKQEISRVVEELLALEEVYAIEVFSASNELLYPDKDTIVPISEGIEITKTLIVIEDSRLPIASDLSEETVDQSLLVYRLGTVVLYLTTSEIGRESQDALILRSVAFSGIIFLVVLLLFVITNHARKYVKELLSAMQGVQEGSFIPIRSRWSISEFDDISDGMNNLTSYLDKTINELVEAEKRADSAKQEAIQADQFKSNMIQVFSHELRTPINTIVNLFELIARNIDTNGIDSVLNQHLAVCRAACKELHNIVDELFDFRQLESGALGKNISVFEPRTLFGELQDLYQPRFDHKKLTLSVVDVSVENSIHGIPSIMTDWRKLQRILANLLENALKYTNYGSVVMQWSILKRQDSYVLMVKIKDSGVGIEYDAQKKIFEKFYQIDNPEVKKTGGWGLGLSYVNELLKLLEGEITVESMPNVGSTFTVVIPVGVEYISGDKEVQESNISDLSELRVMVVDDNENNCYTLSQMMKQFNIDTVTEIDPEKAFEIANDNLFHIIFLDYHMPGIGGIELMRRIRKTKINRNSTIICVTADVRPEVKSYLVQEHIDGVLTKPVEAEELYKLISEVYQASIEAKNIINKIKDDH